MFLYKRKAPPSRGMLVISNLWVISSKAITQWNMEGVTKRSIWFLAVKIWEHYVVLMPNARSLRFIYIGPIFFPVNASAKERVSYLCDCALDWRGILIEWDGLRNWLTREQRREYLWQHRLKQRNEVLWCVWQWAWVTSERGAQLRRHFFW